MWFLKFSIAWLLLTTIVSVLPVQDVNAKEPQSSEDRERILRISKDLPMCWKPKSHQVYDLVYTRLTLQGYLQNEDYKKLEDTLRCLSESERLLVDGVSGDEAIHSFLYDYARYLKLNKRLGEYDYVVGEWKNLYPESIYAEFAELYMLYEQAWIARGQGFSTETRDQQWKMFKYRLAQTRQALDEASDELRSTVFWHWLLLAVSLDQNPQGEVGRTIQKDMAKRWPYYFPGYSMVLYKEMPKWGGSWKRVDEFIRDINTQLANTEGNTLYARMYIPVLMAVRDPRRMSIDWERMRESLRELMERFPTRKFRNVAASLACYYKDQNFMRHVKGKFAREDFNPDYWMRGTVQSCMSLFTS